MKLRFAAVAVSTALVAACQSAPSTSGAWLMEGNQPWVGADGKCMQLRPLKPDEKSGFCYDVMTGVYQKTHHYETLPQDEFTFLYPKVDPTPSQAYTTAMPDLPQALAAVEADLTPLPSVLQIYTALPFAFNSAHFSSKNKVALRAEFQGWQDKGLKVVSVAVTGHTDSRGPMSYNLLLSKWRAQSVSYFLQRLGVDEKDISLGGVAMLLPNPKGTKEADNRYVDLRVWLVPPRADQRVTMR